MRSAEGSKSGFRQLVVPLSLANLCFWEVWAVLYDPDWSYFLEVPPARVDFLAITLNVLTLTAIFYLLLRIAHEGTTPMRRRLARWGFLLWILLPLDALRHRLPSIQGFIASWGKPTLLLILCASL